MRTHGWVPAAVMAVVAIACLGGCMSSDPRIESVSRSDADGSSGFAPTAIVPAGTPLAVRLDTRLSSKTARVGDAWDGAVVSSVTIGSREVIPAGSAVRGIVTATHEAARGARAILELAVLDVAVDGATATGVVASSQSHPVVLRPGTVMMFTVSDQVVMRRG